VRCGKKKKDELEATLKVVKVATNTFNSYYDALQGGNEGIASK
jgi:hypothetical protein